MAYAYHTYQELPYDKDHLFYKYTTFKDFNPKSLTHNWKYNGEGNHELLKTYEQNLKPFMVETTNSLQSSLPEDLQKIGVFFDTLHNLIKIDEVKAKKIISMVDKSTSKFDKLGSLSRAFAVNIIVLYVPKNVIITEIIGKITQINNSTTANFGEFIAIFEDGSQATYYNIYNDNSSDNNAKLYSIIETVIVGDNARVKSFQLQDFNPSAVFYYQSTPKLIVMVYIVIYHIYKVDIYLVKIVLLILLVIMLKDMIYSPCLDKINKDLM